MEFDAYSRPGNGTAWPRLWAVMAAGGVPLWDRDALLRRWATSEDCRSGSLNPAVVEALGLLAKPAYMECMAGERCLLVPVRLVWAAGGLGSWDPDEQPAPPPDGVELATALAEARPDWPGTLVVDRFSSEEAAYHTRRAQDSKEFLEAWARAAPLEERMSAERIFGEVWASRHRPPPRLDLDSLPPVMVRFTGAAHPAWRARFSRPSGSSPTPESVGRPQAFPDLGWPEVEVADVTASQGATLALARAHWGEVWAAARASQAERDARLREPEDHESARLAAYDARLRGTYGPHAVAFLDGRPASEWTTVHRALDSAPAGVARG